MILKNYDLKSMFCSTAVYFHIDSSATFFFFSLTYHPNIRRSIPTRHHVVITSKYEDRSFLSIFSRIQTSDTLTNIYIYIVET